MYKRFDPKYLRRYAGAIVLFIFMLPVFLIGGCEQVIPGFFNKGKASPTTTVSMRPRTGGYTTAAAGTQAASAAARSATAASLQSLGPAAATFSLVPGSAETVVTIYYQLANGTLVPVSRKIPWQTGIARATLKEMTDSESLKLMLMPLGLKPVLGSGVEVLGINIRDGLATVDFSGPVFSAAGTEEEEASIVAALVYTLTGFSTIDRVSFMQNGAALKQLPFGADLSEPLTRGNVMINASKANLPTGLAKSDLYFYTVYQGNAVRGDIQYLVPISVEHTKVNGEELPEKILQLYGMNYGDPRLISLVPKEVAASQAAVSGDTVQLDTELAEARALDQIMYAFKQLEGITKIKIGSSLSAAAEFPAFINAYLE